MTSFIVERMMMIFFIGVGAVVESNEFVPKDGNTSCAGVAPACAASALVGGVFLLVQEHIRVLSVQQ